MLSGREQLAAWIDRRFQNARGKQGDAAELLGLDQSYVSQILSGHRRPGLDMAVKIQRLTGIPAEAWVPVPDGGTSEPVAANGLNSRDSNQ